MRSRTDEAAVAPRHDLDSPWPEFLNLIDSDPRLALEGLHVYAWKLLEARPPSVLWRLDPADRQDRIAELVVSCYRDDFRKLRSYRNVGRPFSAWLVTVFVRQVLDWLRSVRPTDELTDCAAAAEADNALDLSERVIQCLRRCMGRMSEKCRLYLTCVADGMRPREIALLLRLPEGDNKRVSDDIRHCLRRFRELVLAEGLSQEELAL